MNDFIDLLSKIPAGFYGSLLGSFISGSVAIGILGYQVRQKNKDYNYRCYGTMKIITVHLVIVKSYSDLIREILKTIRQYPNLKDKTILQLKRPKELLEKTLSFLENERDNIPYSFISRYHTVTNSLVHVIRSLEDAVNADFNEVTEKGLLNQLDHLEKIDDDFIKYGSKYLITIEKKYKIKDYY